MINLTVIGRVTKDAQTRTVKVNGVDTLVTDFTVAGNDGYGDNKITSFFKVSVWRDKGAKMALGLKKGRIITVSGAVVSRAWVGQDGKAYSEMEIKNPDIEFIDKRPEDPEEAPEAENEADKPF